MRNYEKKLLLVLLFLIAVAMFGRSLQAQDVVAIDAGGGAAGSFASDMDFTQSSGGTAVASAAIDTSQVVNPAPQGVYQNERWGAFTYTIPGLTAGSVYTVRLHFSENSYNSAGIRNFNVVINGQQVLTNFDIFAVTGAQYKAMAKDFTAVANASGQIVVQFTPGTSGVQDPNAALKGIEVQTAQDVVAIDGGGGAAGSYAADEDYSGSSGNYSNGNTIDTSAVVNPAPQAVYDSERYAAGGPFTYTIAGLTAGSTYTVRLHWAEIYYTQPGQRQFNVSINGMQVLTNFDIVATAGAPNKAIAEDFTAVSNSSGQIVIGFTYGNVDGPKISGIEIQGAGSGGTGGGGGGGGTGGNYQVFTPGSLTLNAGQQVTLNNFTLSQQLDGHLVAYLNNSPVWDAPNTYQGNNFCTGSNTCVTSYQGTDGNLVVYIDGQAKWSAGSNGSACLIIENTVPYLAALNSSGGVVWSSGGSGTPQAGCGSGSGGGGGGGGATPLYINLGGSAETEGGVTYVSDATAGITLGSGTQTYTSNNPSWTPSGDAALGAILNTQVYATPGSGSFTVPLTPGNYEVSVGSYENYASNARSFNLLLNGQVAGSGIGSQPYDNWTEYGPYSVTVDSSGVLTVGLGRISGDPSLSYMKIIPGGSGSGSGGGSAPIVTQPSGASMGPLQVAPGGYYFETPAGQPIYLSGSHNWMSQEDWLNPGPGPFNFSGYLSYLTQQEHGNFIRDWTGEHTELSSGNGNMPVSPLPWARSSQCCAADGGNLFDLSQFDDSVYFPRLVSRVQQAEGQGAYVSVMLFVGNWDSESPNWNYNPWNGSNHISSNNVNPASGYQVENLGNSTITNLQNAYVCHVVQNVGNYPNVLYEVANEAGQKSEDVGGSYTDLQNNFQWQQAIVNQVHACESQYGYARHPVGITSLSDCGGSSQCATEKSTTNGWMLSSNADWIAPGGPQYQSGYYNSSNGTKVVMIDTDHIFGGGGNAAWVWGQFMQGNNVLYMDDLSGTGVTSVSTPSNGDFPGGRAALNETREATSYLAMNNVVPNGGLSSTGSCLSDSVNQYIVYDPNGGAFTVNLHGVTKSLYVTWINIGANTTSPGGTIAAGGSTAYQLNPPFGGAAAVVLSPAN